MIDRKAQIIVDFFNSQSQDNVPRDNSMYLKLHALFKCLEPQDLINLYFDQFHNGKLKDTILSFIVRNGSAQKEKYNSIMASLLKTYDSKEYKQRVASRLLFARGIDVASSQLKKKYFDHFINSDRISERKLAYQASEQIWKKVKKELWNRFLETLDEQAFEVVFPNSTPKELVQNLQHFWLEDFPANYLKKQIINKTANEDIEYFSFIKDVQPSFYIEVLFSRNLPIPAELLDPIINRLKQESDPLLFYYLGSMKDWDGIIALLDEYYHKSLF